MQPTALYVVTSLDAADQAVVTMNLQCDLADTAAVRIEVDAQEAVVRWWVSDLTGPVDEGADPVEHPCVSCSMREVILPLLARLAGTGRWQALVVALPLGAEALPLAHGIAERCAEEIDLRACIEVVPGDDLCAAVFDDVLLDEVGLALVEDDRRAYGEVLVNNLELADVVVLANEHPDEPDTALLAHLVRPDCRVVTGLTGLDAATHPPTRRDHQAARDFVDPRRRHATGAPDAGHIVTLELESWLPFHPGRLLELVEALGGGDVRGRGAFWLPGRPHTAIVWESSGGQASVGDGGPWGEGDAARRTRLVLTSDDERAPQLEAAFAAALMTEAELVQAQSRWLGRSDGWEEWLGDVEGRSSVA